MQIKRSPGIIAIVIYKGLAAVLLTVTAISLLFLSFQQQLLINLSETYMLEDKLIFLEWLLKKAISTQPRTLELTGIVTSLYAVVTAVEAIGLWYEKAWAELLVIGLVSISIPLEIYELSKGFTLIKFAIFIINVLILVYLIYYFRKSKKLANEPKKNLTSDSLY
ncbi:DUF2127 domain-containing protein [Chroococcus sp. FPU101]|uniref:DUF2127 domain-containing protein n=1 Tax=Chroococcus sp. FPU101 TaxID=1974212 RepID=UPI001A8CCA1A|nr:DUF2127 domain-containing protein [Chroococcus sp. FPU101]GFE67713.1 hypothetical protein CFPU101_03230 [Chroococcus sp. FPU101]